MSKTIEIYKKYTEYYISKDIEYLKSLLRQYEIERATGLGLNMEKIVALKHVIKEKSNS